MEREEERKRLERIAALPPPDHNELVVKAVEDVRKTTLDIYQTCQKRRRLGRVGRLRRKLIPRMISDIKQVGFKGNLKIFTGGIILVSTSEGIFYVCSLADRLIGWSFYLSLLCGYLWKSDELWMKWEETWTRMKYPSERLTLEDLQYELKIPDADTAGLLFQIIHEAEKEEEGGSLSREMDSVPKSTDRADAAASSTIPLHVVKRWKKTSYLHGNALEMVLGTWDFDEHGYLIRQQLSPVVLSLINAGLLKPQEGAEYIEKNDKDFPPNWKDPHNEEVLAWPLAFDPKDQKEKVRASNQVVEELMVLHGMQFEGENLDGELCDLHFPGCIRYLAARCGYEDLSQFKYDWLSWIRDQLAEEAVSKPAEENKNSSPFQVFPGQQTQTPKPYSESYIPKA